MVDISHKEPTTRTAVASCVVAMSGDTRTAVFERTLDKGDALAVARVAGIMAAKRTAELIPLCHPIALSSVDVTFERASPGIAVRATARTVERTGVEMEALTAAGIAAVTIYDMVKGLERGVEISSLRLDSKTGGVHEDWHR